MVVLVVVVMVLVVGEDIVDESVMGGEMDGKVVVGRAKHSGTF